MVGPTKIKRKKRKRQSGLQQIGAAGTEPRQKPVGAQAFRNALPAFGPGQERVGKNGGLHIAHPGRQPWRIAEGENEETNQKGR